MIKFRQSYRLGGLFRWLWLVVFFIGFGKAYSQVFHDQYFRTEAAKGLDFTYNLQFEEADGVFSRLESRYSTHPAPLFLKAVNRWWQSYISTTDHYHDFIEESLEKSLELNEKMEKTPGYDLEFTFFQYMSYAFLTRLYILRREWLRAANTGRKALPYLEDALGYTSRSPEFFFSAGIYHYYAEVYPKDHIYVRPFTVFFPDGDARLGLEELGQAAENRNFTQAEALYYLGDIYLEEEGDVDNSLIIKEKLARLYPENTWFAVDFARVLVHDHQYQRARVILEKFRQTFEAIPHSGQQHITSVDYTLTSQIMVRVYHYLGVISMEQESNYQKALKYLNLSLKMGEISGLEADIHLPASQYLVGRCYDYLGKTSLAVSAYHKAINMPENQDVKHLAEACLRKNCP